MTTFIQTGAAYAAETHLSREVDVANGLPSRSREVSVSAPREDTVTLSVSNEIEGLLHQGDSVAQIANTLGLTTTLVNTYLFVPPATESTAPAAKA